MDFSVLEGRSKYSWLTLVGSAVQCRAVYIALQICSTNVPRFIPTTSSCRSESKWWSLHWYQLSYYNLTNQFS
jgi:hypothetical protein